MSDDRTRELLERAQRDLARGEVSDESTRLEVLEDLYRELEGALEAGDEASQARR